MLVIAYVATLGEVVFEIAFKKVREYRQSFIIQSGFINGKDDRPVQAYGVGHSGGEVYTDSIPPAPLKGEGGPQEGPRLRDDDADNAEVDACTTRRSSRSQSAFHLPTNGNNGGGSNKRSDKGHGHGQSFQQRGSRTSDGDIESVGTGISM
jgi:hypothetical protein